MFWTPYCRGGSSVLVPHFHLELHRSGDVTDELSFFLPQDIYTSSDWMASVQTGIQIFCLLVFWSLLFTKRLVNLYYYMSILWTMMFFLRLDLGILKLSSSKKTKMCFGWHSFLFVLQSHILGSAAYYLSVASFFFLRGASAVDPGPSI